MEKHKNDTVNTFDTNISVMCKDILDYLEQEPSGDAVSRDFQIGDEVRIIGSDPIYDDCDVGWVIRNASERVKTMYVMRNDGSADEENKAEWYKTGRHNAMLAEVIKQLPSVKPQESCDVPDINDGKMSESPTDSKDVIWYSKRNYSEIVVEPQEGSEA